MGRGVHRATINLVEKGGKTSEKGSWGVQEKWLLYDQRLGELVHRQAEEWYWMV